MKKYNPFSLITNIFTFLMITIMNLSCNKTEKVYDSVVFLAAATTSNYAKITADETGKASFNIQANLSDLLKEPVTIQIEIDTSLIKQYNKLNNRAYKPLPNGSYQLSSNRLSIASGSSLSDIQKLEILSTDDFKEGVSYIVPITIKSAGSVRILSASKTLFIEVGKTVFNAGVSLANNYFKVDFSTNNSSLKEMTNITYEVKVKANAFQNNTPFISSIMGIEEHFLLRFGDVTVEPNQLQVAGGATATNVPTLFTANTWYHLAASYNGSQLKVYIDGVLVSTKDAVRTINLVTGQGFYFGFSAGGRYLNGAISEARVWSRGLSESEIINGMCGVDPNSPDLVGYWKFNEGEGNIAHDISGNEHHATAKTTPIWLSDIKCN